MESVSSDVLVKHVTITARRNGKGKLKASWVVELSNGKTEEYQKVFRNLGELRKEIAEMKEHCISRGMKPEEMTIQNFYS